MQADSQRVSTNMKPSLQWTELHFLKLHFHKDTLSFSENQYKYFLQPLWHNYQVIHIYLNNNPHKHNKHTFKLQYILVTYSRFVLIFFLAFQRSVLVIADSTFDKYVPLDMYPCFCMSSGDRKSSHSPTG